MALMKVGNQDINREDLIFDTVRNFSHESPAVHAWLTMWKANRYGYGMTREEALIGMVITLHSQLKEAERRLVEAVEC